MEERSDKVRLGVVHEDMGVHTLFFCIPRPQAVHTKGIIDSYAEIGVLRSQDPEFAPGTALMVLLVVPDFAAEAVTLMEGLAADGSITFIDATPARLADLRRDLRCLY